ncbi:hypothetical protein P9E76_13795 [Schinkia azotoformans]|uniref:Uncharacterized protein n=1 Tax=Schinkia azotoformans LMG 9581 TaxID=1131731 RepID=K6DLA1_SCHAZ|nr:hypothetical protein [Schinkia azotoformans]EKN68953.1 hypothetical protein BAZO_01757 [Schinkia azotoformans LMG 9581]MEC1638453.1 hypothetical protein [Schinkia azotoformans]MEC1946113.1 hypothetical protein [Schinkia azotoformans]
MKKIVAIVIVLFVVLVGWLYYVNLTNVDEFRLTGYTIIQKDKVKENEPMYLSYDMQYHGNGKPVIKEIRFIKTDGSFLTADDEALSVTAFIDEKGSTLANTNGAITEEEAKELNLLENYIPVENYQVNKKDLNIVLKVTVRDENYKNNVTAIEIDYELLGSKETKQILISGFVE